MQARRPAAGVFVVLGGDKPGIFYLPYVNSFDTTPKSRQLTTQQAHYKHKLDSAYLPHSSIML